MVEITMRTHRRCLLLRPSDELNERILGILGRALFLYPIALHAFVFLSNHWHALATVQDAARLADFLRYVNCNLTKAVQDVYGWEDTAWSGRAKTIAVVDDEAAEGRLRYILGHGAKEGLVSSPLDWPGVSSVRALALGEEIVGRWRDRALAAQLRRRKSGALEEEAITCYPIQLTPLPAWASLPPEQQRRRVLAMIADIEADARHEHPIPLGREEVLTQDPFSAPMIATRTPAPPVHASCPVAREQFLTSRAVYVEVYRGTAQSTGSLALAYARRFPLGAFPPRPPLSQVSRPPDASHPPPGA
jgi:hypothetical protein